LRPGGWVVFGLYAAPADPLGAVLTDLRVIRGGGHPWTVTAAEEQLRQHGFSDVHTVERTWESPIDLVVGRRGERAP
jgi:hypothetical protein